LEEQVTKRISKKVREEAARICAIAASSGDDYPRPCYDQEIAIDLGLYRGSASATMKVPAIALAVAAWTRVFDASDEMWSRATDAEAEALLRTGWTP
jgi:hypothetical protein